VFFCTYSAAELLKATGNEQFKNKQYPEAIASYTMIIKNPNGVPANLLRLAHSNRAACYMELSGSRQLISPIVPLEAYTNTL